MKRVVCGMSGGVDSSVAAFLLKKNGFNVLGVFMRNWDASDEAGQGVCTADRDYEDARLVCEKIKIPLLQVDFIREYWNEVFSELIKDYRSGLTPNPDVVCNRHIKFGSFHKYATRELGANAVATGHYARTSFGNFLEKWKPHEDVKLLTSKDPTKDQTLFLSRVPQESLRRAMFPLGDKLKVQVRQIAASEGFTSVADKKSSKGICFIGCRRFQEFIEEYVEPRSGNFIDVGTNRIVGTHTGIHKWTVGQRCRISGKPIAYFIAKKLLDSHDILVAPGHDHPLLYTRSFTVEQPYWIRKIPTNDTEICGFRFQQTAPLILCSLSKNNDGTCHVRIDQPQRAITPGQYAVFYNDDECLGSARIISTFPLSREDENCSTKSRDSVPITGCNDALII